MKSLLTFTFLVLLSLPALAADAQPSTEEINRYMEVSGISEMIDSMPAQIEASLNQQLLVSEDPDTDREVAQILADTWQPKDIHSSVAIYIQANASEREIGGLLEWRQDPLLIKITEAEKTSSSPDFQNDFLRYIADLQATPPTPETTEAIIRLVNTTGLADLMVETTVLIAGSMATAFTEARGFGTDETQAELDQKIATMRTMLRPQMEQQAILMSYYIYRDITNEELNSYSTFYESDLGRRELALLYGSLNQAMSQWARESGEAIMKSVGSKTDV